MHVKRKWAVALVAAALILSAGRPAAGILYDLVGHWAGAMVTALESRGLVAGDTRGNFNPDAPLTRAEMAKLITAGIGNGDDANLLARYPSRFRDVPNSHWAKGFIESLAEAGVTEGYGDGTFGPGDTVTRAQMAVFLVRAAGLADEARLARFQVSAYNDDREVPDWARGSVHVALKYGLMLGFGDNTFRPLAPITRAEGSVALFRLMAYRGDAFHLTGTLLSIDPIERRTVIRTEAGQERTLGLTFDAQVYRGGARVTPFQLQLLDQVWVILNSDGRVVFIEARYADLLTTSAAVDGRTLAVTTAAGVRRTLTVQDHALIFLNGRSAKLEDVAGAEQVYLALDRVHGDVRLIDALKGLVAGQFGGYDAARGVIALNNEILRYAPDIVVLRDGLKVDLSQLEPGIEVKIARSPDGLITYLQAER